MAASAYQLSANSYCFCSIQCATNRALLKSSVWRIWSFGRSGGATVRASVSISFGIGHVRVVFDNALQAAELGALVQRNQRHALRGTAEFSNPRKAGIIAVGLDDGDFLVGAALTDGQHDVMLFSDGGKAVRFDENDVRPMGRLARGVRGMALEDGQHVIAMLVAEDESQSVLTATENGFGKRTSIAEYTRHGRGTKGMIAIQPSERNGKVVTATLVHADDEIMLITDTGVLVRTRVSEIREMGRATQGVTLIALDAGARLIGLQRIVENDAADDETPDDADQEQNPETPPTDAGASADES